MGFAGATLNTVGAVLLTHAIYSTHEHSTLTSSPTTATAHPLPLDITLELLFALLLLTSGIVLTSPSLKPIQWSRWSGKLSRQGRESEGRYTREGEEVLGEGDPFAGLGLDGGWGEKGAEGRRGFWDVRGMRAEYEGWVRKEGGK